METETQKVVQHFFFIRDFEKGYDENELIPQ